MSLYFCLIMWKQNIQGHTWTYRNNGCEYLFKNMVFSEGYNRRLASNQEKDWEVVRHSQLASDSASKQMDDSESTKAEVTEVISTEIASELESGTAISTHTYVPLHDPKNQLSSLVKNAQKNRDALQKRNESVKQAKARSKRQYGW
ncbi:(ZYRO0G01870g) [Zygosaccharomyces parabailii]|uniref:BN860_15786g1_1 n=1 Tax=Zygosaccharomyces bailii (strain CLIB 213 / ATCC 58445 / CBS 680 / BCRC 21525 / NBRC 1098 / NCYC 1416 / NRRL Y-2227) TaxID=1333698 RepID=A0A8J2X6Q7_ZYGB2|nr:(ZYRO0G01870g) [Zygosaccharomyces parabailii]AQZ16946.1 (ZYRO0G01870g) [Zygosaccharomyces parabailii]CDF88674.1 BN860_15786g1_1 [Zygosaccharomyces bailii CLIB 213]